uniref:NADH dehydrogenase [ubiquinone] 1 beta subcomplex subunit 5, mitochondrial n=1 Tax=Aquarana catesbeiana TaxID=8400 RepID=C1C3P2_AQUCT|nr:NADH dehydrogenase 1 beta subcomplex subunit 5, mitochondrial precursor [Aquarana catesbeiana]
MAGMSVLRSAGAMISRLQCAQRWALRTDGLLGRGAPAAAVPVRSAGGGKRVFVIRPSLYHDNKFKKYLKFYILLGVIPAGICISLINIFIGPAELAEIPEGYVPEHWEYYQHPITRWLSRNVFHPVDESYERGMTILYNENEKRQLRLYEDVARASMRKKGDGPWYYYETLDKNLIDHEPKSVPDQ